VARILIINMLRETLKLECIAYLMSYINGNVDDRSDDIVPESVLYEYICCIVDRCKNCDFGSDDDLKKLIADCTADYKEIIPGSAERLRKALEIIVLAYQSARIKAKAENLLNTIK
jgi:hypothetical protein